MSGTVREVDPPGLPLGVRVDFDGEVNGVNHCYATHGELVRGDETALGNQIAEAIFLPHSGRSSSPLSGDDTEPEEPA